MAEGGGDEDEKNPFSFKNFVQKKDKKKESPDDDRNRDNFDIFDLPDSPSQRRREKARPTLVVEDDTKKDVKKQKKKGKSENPFSFKRFLETGSGSSATKAPSGTAKKASPAPALSSAAPDVASDLPDFVQGHFCDSSRDPDPKSVRGLELPDFTLSASKDTSHLNDDIVEDRFRTSSCESIGSDSLTSSKISDIPSREGSAGSQDFSLGGDHLVRPRKTRLPDFLSDGILGSGESFIDSREESGQNRDVGEDIPQVIHGANMNGDIHVQEELQRLRDENRNLRVQLSEVEKSKQAESEKVVEAKNELVRQQKKELEETAAMEKIIQQVEENLTTSTKRAVQAENTVSKLKQEVKALQSQVQSLQSENSMLRSGDKGLIDIKERTKYAAEQLAGAATTAETSLRQLLSGVDNLKLLSQVLDSIDKISEDSPSNGPKQRDKTKDDT